MDRLHVPGKVLFVRCRRTPKQTPKSMLRSFLFSNRFFAVAAVLLLAATSVRAQVVTHDPAFPTEAQPVTIYFHAKEGTGGLAGYTGDVYAHTGVLTNLSTSLGDWRYVKTNWGQNTPATKLERLAPDEYKLTIADVRAYYGVPASETIQKLAFVFRSGVQVGGAYKEGKAKDAGGAPADIFVDLFQGGVNVRFSQPSVSALNPIIAARDTTIEVEAVASVAGASLESLRLLVGGVEVSSTGGDTLRYSLPLTTAGRFDVQAIARSSDATADTASFYAVRNPEVVNWPLPENVIDGIGMNDADPTTATLSFYAPGKSFAYVIGSFNDWEIDPAFFMHKDGSRFWITLHGLDPGREYAFQYYIDGSLRMADLYSEKVLVPGDDAYITPETYPDLMPYPENKTVGPVTVFTTGEPDFAFSAFDAPPQSSLVIYELLVRDFLAAHDYETLTDTLSYLERLGINAIELMPVSEFDGNLSWGYNPDFHLAADKYYGSAESLKWFVEQAHRRGIAVILDVVYNHAHDDSPLVRLYGAVDANPFINVPARHPFSVFLDLNHENPYVQYWLDRANRFWLEEYNVDGYRFDLSKGFTQKNTGDNVGAWGAYDASRVAILTRMADRIWDVDPEAYVILEHLGDNAEERVLAEYGTDNGKPGLMLWGKMTDAYNEATMGYNSSGASNFAYGYYGTRGWAVPNLVTYMESHDEERLMVKNLAYGACAAAPAGSAVCSGASSGYSARDPRTALERMKMAGAFFFTIPGPKMIWQFGELGYDVSIDQNGRTGSKPILWQYAEDMQRKRLYDAWAAMIHLRNDHEVFSSPETQVTMATTGAVKTIRLVHPSLSAVIVGNFDVLPREVTTAFPAAGTWYDYFSGSPAEVPSSGLAATLAPGEFHIYLSAYVAPPEGNLIGVGTEERAAELPGGLTLGQNYPNPFASHTVVPYTVSATGSVRLAVYDVLGREVGVLVDEVVAAGAHTARFNADALPSGTYFYRLRGAADVQTGIMTVAR